MQEGKLGREVRLGRPLDTWSPQARGSSARVFEGFVVPLEEEGAARTRARLIAVKMMRPNEKDYAVPLFKEEVKILDLLRDVPGVMRMVEAGFIYSGDLEKALLQDENNGRGLTGQVYRYLPEEAQDFLEDFDTHLQRGGLPYIGARVVSARDNLWRHCDRFLNRGRYLPVATGLEIAHHAVGILAEAHRRGVIYRDHKIVHYYWHRESFMPVPVTVIDWNVGEYFPQGVPEEEIIRDVVSFAASMLYHVLTGEKHPYALNVGPARKEEIENAPARFDVDWGGVHRPLDDGVKDLLERALRGEYGSAEALQEAILSVRERLRSRE